VDPLIRSARLASERARLSEARVSTAPHSGSNVLGRDDVARETLRAEIERQVRIDLGADMQRTLEVERERVQLEARETAIQQANAVAAAELKRLREQFVANAERAITALERAHHEAMSQLESSVGEVTFAAVCRLIGREMSSRAWVMDLVQNTCSRLRGESSAIARLHPRDIQILNDLLQERELRLNDLSLKVVSDESLELGGCRIEAASGHYDGSLESQLRALHAVLMRSDVPVSGGET
jgi:flagellar assembly protein FliH